VPQGGIFASDAYDETFGLPKRTSTAAKVFGIVGGTVGADLVVIAAALAWS
jgi:hypothetical protein